VIGRTLFRYVFMEMLRALAVALSWLLLIGLLVVFLRSRFTDAGRLLGLRECLAGLIVVIPYLFGFLLPLAMLAAAVSAFGRLSANNELTAMRASGLSPLAVAAAPLSAGLIAGLLVLWLNMEGYRYAATALAAWETRIELDKERLTRPGSSFSLGAGDHKWVFSFPPPLDDGSRPLRVSRLGPGGFQLSARHHRCEIEVRRNRKGRLRRFVSFDLERVQLVQDPFAPYSHGQLRRYRIKDLELPGAISRALIGGGSAMRTSLPENLAQLRKERRRLAGTIRRLQTRLPSARARLAAWGAGGGGGGAALAAADRVRRRQEGILDSCEKMAATKAEVSRKLAFSLSPLLFVLVGIGLGACARRSSQLIGLSLGVLVAVLYYGSWVSAKALYAQGLLPPTLYPWIPNALSLIAGALLLRYQRRT